MHVKAKTMAFGGLLLALTVICMALGSVIETNTLFLLAAASYFTGIVIREFGLKTGLAFYLAAVILGVILAPNKFYVITFAAMGFYILGREAVWYWMSRHPEWTQRQRMLLAAKFILFNLVYLPIVFLFQELLFAKALEGIMILAVIVAGQILFLIYDRAYDYVQRELWGKLRGKFDFLLFL